MFGCVRFERRAARSVTVMAFLLVAASTLAACNQTAPSTGSIQAVGAESQYANVIAQLGGRYVHVQSILNNPNTDPHTFEVSTRVAQEVSDAQLIVQNGLGYDAFMTQLEAASTSSDRHVLVAQQLLHLSNRTSNPHLWYLPSAMAIIAPAITRSLERLRPHDTTYFAAKLQRFLSSLRTFQNAVQLFRSRHAGVTAATTEPVADYLLQALGIRILTPVQFEADVMNGVDPSPQDITTEQSLLARHRVTLFCYNEQVVSSLTISLRSLAKQSNVPTVAVYETMPIPGYSYQSWMVAEVAAISRAVTAGSSTARL
jgi:zinc/manganese transport system substrate-binding protein